MNAGVCAASGPNGALCSKEPGHVNRCGNRWHSWQEPDAIQAQADTAAREAIETLLDGLGVKSLSALRAKVFGAQPEGGSNGHDD